MATMTARPRSRAAAGINGTSLQNQQQQQQLQQHPPAPVWLPAHRSTIPPLAPPTNPAAWLFPRAVIDAQYSRATADRDAAAKVRDKAVQFIFRMGHSLRHPATVIATAAVFLHRLYMTRSFGDPHQLEAAAACVYLAGKTDEHFTPVEKVARAAAYCAHKGRTTGIPDGPMSSLPGGSTTGRHSAVLHPEFVRWQEAILRTELLLVDALRFDFIVEHPHRILANYLATTHASRMIYNVAHGLLNDSARTTLALQYQPVTVAAAALHLAQQITDQPLPPDWQAVLAINRFEMLDAAHEILNLFDPGFQLPPPPPPPALSLSSASALGGTGGGGGPLSYSGSASDLGASPGTTTGGDSVRSYGSAGQSPATLPFAAGSYLAAGGGGSGGTDGSTPLTGNNSADSLQQQPRRVMSLAEAKLRRDKEKAKGK
ncbi:cyclin-like protein [Blastocladiella britannica]|nr:cyclin-like protein [Blastocladiella britannica]